MLNIQNIHYQLSSRLSLRKISFDVAPGELVVLLGANGAGKSSLLNIITGSIRPHSGNVLISGLPLKYWHASQLACFAAVQQQQQNLQLPYSVFEVVMMGRYPHFKRNAGIEDEAIVLSVLEQHEIIHLKDRNYLTLSGGEQQRVHLARVMAQVTGIRNGQTAYLFMDEPSNNLDIRHQHTALQLARRFARKGNCVLAVLHDLNLALQYADKIALLKDGVLTGFGPPATVLTTESVSALYDMPLTLIHAPDASHPVVVARNPHLIQSF